MAVKVRYLKFLESEKMKNYLKVALTAASIIAASPSLANAEDKLDVSTITCEVATAMDAETITMIMFFIDGYTGGEAGDPILDAERLSSDIVKVLTACISEPSKTLMTAMKEALAG
jgi:hypothetical protein